MTRKKAFIYVGHSHWGKSFALKQLTNGSSRKKTVLLNNKWFWVRKMSNDDTDIGLHKFVKTIPNLRHQHFILAYCPNHDTRKRAQEILIELESSCDLYFFVQQQKYTNAAEVIPESELTRLREIGTVEVLTGKVEDTDRAHAFRTFIENNL